MAVAFKKGTSKNIYGPTNNNSAMGVTCQLWLCTSSGTIAIDGRTYTVTRGNYYLYYELKAYWTTQINSSIRINGGTYSSSNRYLKLTSGSTTLWDYNIPSSSNTDAYLTFNNNSSSTWNSVRKPEWTGDYTQYPKGLYSTGDRTSSSVTATPVSNNITVTLSYHVGFYHSQYQVNQCNGSVSGTPSDPGGIFTLTKVSATGSLLAVKYNGTDLANNATIYQGDVLDITYSEQTGYTTTLTVNGTTQNSGYSHTVSGNTTVITTATLKSYNFSASPSSHGQIRVRRTAGQSPLNTDLVPGTDKLYYNDTIQIIFSIQSSAYEIVSCTMNDSVVPAETSFGVALNTDDFVYAFAMTEQVKRWALVITTNNYTNKLNYAVNRINSPLGNGSTGPVSNGDLIYYNDVLELDWSCDPGYSANCKVNTTKIQETQLPYQWTTTISPTLTLYGEAIQYTLARTAADCTITVERTFSNISDVPIGLISDDEKIYYGDKLNITVTPASSQQLSIFTINNVDVKNFNPYNDYTVTTDTFIIAICALSGAGYIKIGNEWVSSQAYILINNNWQQCQGYVLQNGQWVQCQ